MLDIGVPELLIVLTIVVLLFGPGRIAKTMGELGKGFRSFKESISSEDESPSASDTNTSPNRIDP